MKKVHVVYTAAVALMAWGCTGQANKEQQQTNDTTAAEAGSQTVLLSEQEKADGWILLFDGESTQGWKGYNRDDVPAAWVVEDGTLTLDTAQLGSNGGDILTAGIYEDYELRLEWKISPNGNSGIIYNVVEGEENPATYSTGPEMQVLDNDGHPDGKIEKHRAGDLYDLVKSSEEPVKPVGEWNQIRLVQKDGKIEQWLNGVKVAEADMNSPEWAKLVAGSKFGSMPDFGKSQKGHIALQEHDNKVWYRNIKLKPL